MRKEISKDFYGSGQGMPILVCHPPGEKMRYIPARRSVQRYRKDMDNGGLVGAGQ